MGKFGSYDPAPALSGTEEVVIKGDDTYRLTLDRILDELSAPLEDVPPGTLVNLLGVTSDGDVSQQSLADLLAAAIVSNYLGDVAARDNLGGQLPIMNYGIGGRTGAGSNVEGTQLSAVMPIGAGVGAVNDQYVLRFAMVIANLTGGTLTSRIRSYLGAHVIGDRTYSLLTFTGLTILGEVIVTIKQLGGAGASLIHAQSNMFSGPGTGVGENFPQFPTAAGAWTDSTNAAINFDITSQHSATTAGFATTLHWASLRPLPRF